MYTVNLTSRLKGLEARRVYAEPKGAWFSRVGKLHTVFHVWKYDSMEERARIREAAWQAKVRLFLAFSHTCDRHGARL